MKYAAFVVGVVVATAGCDKKKAPVEPPAPSRAVDSLGTAGSNGMIVQPRIGGSAGEDEGSVPFTITAVHEGQKPSTTAPFYEAGGTWTYFEAHLVDDPAASFLVGVPTLVASKDGPGFGKLMFAPTTHDAGAHVVDRLAKVLRTTAPPPRAGGQLQAVKVPIALLGHEIDKLGNGLGGAGTWDATKLFCSVGAIDSAELFFNFSIADKTGEFSEKDSDYDKDVVACLATILRDGLPPPRTPANDPTLAAAGPRVELGKKIGAGRMQRIGASPTRLLMLEERGASGAIVEVNVKTGATKDLYSTPDRLDGGQCDDALAHCAIIVSTPKDGRSVFGDDPTRLISLDGTTVTPLVFAAVKKPSLGANAVSPDGRFVVAESYSPNMLVAFDRTTKQTVQLASGENNSLEILAWDGTTAIVRRSSYTEKTAPALLEWRIGAKGATRPSTRDTEPPPVSADGTRRAVFADGVLTLADGGKTRTLAFHPDDARTIGPGCCTWIDNRWMTMRGGFIDTDAMKVSLLPRDAEKDPPLVDYIPGTRTALVSSVEGTYLATIVGP